jgi:hypothetical protein
MKVTILLVVCVFLLGYAASSWNVLSSVVGFFVDFTAISRHNVGVLLMGFCLMLGGFGGACALLRMIVIDERNRFWKEHGSGFEEERTQGRRSLVMTSDFKLSRSSYAYELFDPTLVNRLAASQNIS